MPLFRRSEERHGVPDPQLPPKEQRRLIRESDRRNYTEAGYRALTSYAYARDIVPGKLWSLVHDQLTDRNPPERSAVLVGFHDVELERAVARVLGEKYSTAMASLGYFLPLAGDDTLAGRQMRAVLLFWPDGENAERQRVARVVAVASQFASRFSGVEAFRRYLVEERSGQPLPTGRLVRHVLAAAWTGNRTVADACQQQLVPQISTEARERLQSLISGGGEP